ncbi:MAG: toxin [Spirochaetia bacterium]|nr:toxin [Spirochaetia bacterium]
MKAINWDYEKNIFLQTEKGISFEVVTHYIEKGEILDIMEHPNKEKYPEQKLFVLNIEDYIYIIPFIENKNEIFLKTIMPSRKATKKYLRGNKNEEK